MPKKLHRESPAINAGAAIPGEWPDPLRRDDEGSPDIGALPLGTPLPHIGPKADDRDDKP